MLGLNTRHIRWTAIVALPLFAVAVPAIVMAQAGGDNPVPEDARQLLPESRWSELYCLDARWQVDAAQQSIDDIETTLSSIGANLTAISARTDLPDFASMRTGLNDELATVCDAETALEARDASVELSAHIRDEVGGPINDFATTLHDRIEAARQSMQDHIRTSVDNYLDAERATQESRLRQEFDAQVAQRLNALGRDPTPADRAAAETSARAYVRQLADQVEVTARAQAEQLAEQLRSDDEHKLRAVSNDLNALAERMRNRTSTSLSATAQTHLTEALQARRDAIMIVIDWRIQQFRERIQPRLAGLPSERLQEVQVVLDDIGIDRAQLLEQLNAAMAVNDRAAFDAAVRSFQDSWQERQSDFDDTHLAATITCEAQLDGVEAALGGISTLRDALANTAALPLPQPIRDRITAIDSSLDEFQGTAEEVRTTCEGGDATAADILRLIGQLRSHVAAANERLADLRASAAGGGQ